MHSRIPSLKNAAVAAPLTGSRTPLLAFAVLAFAIAAVGYAGFQHQKKRIKQEVHRGLATAAELKIGQIRTWFESQRRNASVLSRGPFLVKEIGEWLRTTPPSEPPGEKLLQRLQYIQDVHNYRAIFLLDAVATVRFASHPDMPPPSEDSLSRVRQSLQTGKILFSNLHESDIADSRQAELDLLIPLLKNNGISDQAIAVLYARIDPYETLYPIAQFNPGVESNEETLLIRREADHIVYLNEVRDASGIPARRRRAVRDDPLAAAALQGRTGMLEGVDHRGVPVIAAASPINGTDWYLIVKTDVAALYAPLQETARSVAFITLAFILSTALAVLMWWRHQQARFVVRQYEQCLKERALVQHLDYLTRYANDMIFLAGETGRILECNERALEEHGYTREEMLRKNIGDLCVCDPCHTDESWSNWNAEGRIYETEHRRKNGTFFPVEISARLIEVEGKRFRQAIVRDITERKRAQEALRVSEEKLTSILASMHEVVWSFAPDTGELIYLGAAAEKVYGRTPRDFYANPRLRLDLIHPDDRPSVQSYFSDLLQEGEKSVEYRVVRSDGDIRWVRDRARVIYTPEGYAERVDGITSDITERKSAEQTLTLMNRAIESSVNAIVIAEAVGEQNRIVYVNPAFERITGYRAREVLGSDCEALFGADPRQTECEFHRLLREREGHAVLRNHRKNGEPFWNEIFVAPVRNDLGTITHFVGILNDITEQKRYEAQLAHQANHDALTGLPNRNLLQDRLEQAIAYARRNGHMAAVLLLDLDNFKYANDTLGHETGDALLQEIAHRLSTSLRDADTAARLGGDEFVVVLPDVAGGDSASVLARRILSDFHRPLAVNAHELTVTASIGIALYPRDGEDAQSLLRHADAAMYRAKEQGRNNYQFYTEELNARMLERLTTENDLRRALERNEFLLHFQPQVDGNSGDVTGVEALIRWAHPARGLVMPAEFIGIAEETGLITAIGEWVLYEACRQNRAWRDAGLPPMRVAVNLSPRQFQQENLLDTVNAVLKQTGLDAESLTLEITEWSLMQNLQKTAPVLAALKTMGIQVAIDDFGTGYSALSYLRHLPLSILKIDKQLMQDVVSEPHDAAIAGAIIAVAHALNLTVVAEGVETHEQRVFLRERRCDEMQGYLFSRPVPAEEFPRLLRRWKWRGEWEPHTAG